jgi:signal transduction histidine kinase
MQINWESLRADVGGRWFLDRRSMGALVPFLILTSLLSSSNLAARPELWQADVVARYLALLAANIVSLAICWAYLEFAAGTVFRNRRVKPVHIGWVVVFSISIGFLKGFTTGLFSYIFGSELSLELAISNRVLQTSTLGLWTIPIVALAAATFSRYQAEREALVNERVDQAIRAQASFAIPQHQVALRKFIEESRIRISEMTAESLEKQDGKKIAATLREMIEIGLRPISHQIWLSETKARSGFGIRDLTSLALSKNPFPLGVIGVGFAIGLLPLNLVAFETDQALYRTLVSVAVALACYAVFKFAQSRLQLNPVLIFMVGNVIAATAAILLTQWIFGDPLHSETIVLGLALLLWLVQLSFFSSLVGEVLATRSEIRAELEALTGKAGLDSAVDRAANKLASRDLAQHVHSNIQNQLLASALKLEQAEVSKPELEAQLVEVKKMLDDALSSNQELVNGTLAESLNEILLRWQGFVEIELEYEPASTPLSPVAEKSVVQVVNEAISNSVRHGLAARLWLKVQPDNGKVHVTLKDDGLGPRAGAAGLGTELFNAVAPGNWKIELLETGGSLLTMTLGRR